MRKQNAKKYRILGIGSWWCDEIDDYYGAADHIVLGQLGYGTHAARARDGWVVKATR